MWPDNLAPWPRAMTVTRKMEITASILGFCMLVAVVGTAALVASFANITAEFFVTLDLIRVQHRANLSLRVFFDGLNFRTCLCPKLSHLLAALFEDKVHSFALRLVQTEIVVNLTDISLLV